MTMALPLAGRVKRGRTEGGGGAGRGGASALGMSDTSVSETPCQTVDRLVCQPGVLLRVLAGPQELGGR